MSDKGEMPGADGEGGRALRSAVRPLSTRCCARKFSQASARVHLCILGRWRDRAVERFLTSTRYHNYFTTPEQLNGSALFSRMSQIQVVDLASRSQVVMAEAARNGLTKALR